MGSFVDGWGVFSLLDAEAREKNHRRKKENKETLKP
jgi:hypothetical protein